MSNGAGKLKSAFFSSAILVSPTLISCQFLACNNFHTSSCCQFILPYKADLRLPPCITFLPTSFSVYSKGIGPDATPPVLFNCLPDGLALEISTPIPPPVIKQVIARSVTPAHSSLLSSSSLNR